MLGEQEATVADVRPFDLHGVTYYDVTVVYADRSVEQARLGPEAVPDALRASRDRLGHPERPAPHGAAQGEVTGQARRVNDSRAEELVDPPRVGRYLRDLRYAALVDGKDIEELAVQEEIARTAGVDATQFREAIESDEAQREFYGDQAEARVRGITGFPTVTFRGSGTNAREVGVAGFQPTEAYEAALARVTGSRWVEDPPPDLRALLRRAGPLATAEVAEVFDILEDAATLELLALEQKGAARRIEAAGGLFWEGA